MRRFHVAYWILFISLIPAVIVCGRVRYNTVMRDVQRMKNIGQDEKSRADRRVEKTIGALNGIRGLFMASSKVRPAEWNLFLQSLNFDERAAGLRDVGFAVRVRQTDLPAHLDDMATQRADYTIDPPGPRSEYFPILFLRDGQLGDLKAFGWDPYSSKIRRATMDKARDAGKGVCTPTITMHVPAGDHPFEGHILYMPVFRGEGDPATIEERRERLVGFIFASFTSDKLWEAIVPRNASPFLDVEVFEDGKLVYDNHPELAPGAKRKGIALSFSAPVRHGGIEWRLQVTTLPAFAKDSDQYVIWPVMFVCGLISSTLFALALRQAQGREAAERMTNNLRKSERALIESEARFRRLAENARDVIYRFRLKPTFGYDYISPAIERLSGRPASLFYGDLSFMRDFIHPDDRHLLDFSKSIEAWLNGPLVVRWLRKDGSILWTETRNVAVYNEQGGIIAMEGIARDISESKFNEEALRRSEERLARIIETIADGVLILDATGGIAFANAAAEEILGSIQEPRPELEGFVKRLHVHSRRTFSYSYQKADGSEIVLSVNATPFSSREGTAMGVVASIRDVTLEKENEESLVQSQTRLRILNNILGLMAAGSEVTQIVVRTVGELSRNFPEFRIIFSQAGEPGEWNAVCSEGRMPSVKGTSFRLEGDLKEEFFGAKPLVVSDLRADARFEKLRGEGYFEGAQAVLEQPLRHGHKLAGLLSFHSPHPRQWTSAEKVILQEIADYIAAAYAQFDVSEQRRHAEAALEAEKERLAVTLRSIADGVITTDIDGKIILVNRAAEQITGWPQRDAIGRRISEVFAIVDEKTRERLTNPADRALRDGQPHAGLGAILRGRDGKERIITESAAPIRNHNSELIGAALVFRDVTEKRRIERELQKASKLESVGLLAGGIAHDFNNILSVVLGNVTLCKMLSAQNSTVHDRLGQAEKGCLRARELTQQLLTFAKGGAPIRKAASIVEIVHESTGFAARGSNVQCENVAAPDLWAVEVDEGQISQVFNNLVINAIQAMPEGGTLRTRMENREIVPSDRLPVVPGRYVHISVEDTGCGIPREFIPRIFDPYFSTKQDGSGLGLATSYAIIQKHMGSITVESTVGKGTTFQIYLPASSTPVAPKKVVPEPVPRGRGRVLIMDDERAILDLARESLGRFGYDVDTAVHGAEAIEKFQSAATGGRPFEAIIMDLTVPGGMGGKEAMKRLLEIDPKVRAIVSSGYSHDPVMANYKQFGFAGVVEKPYQIDVLAKAIAGIINSN
jgi:PAS domain S-box-containing protein